MQLNKMAYSTWASKGLDFYQKKFFGAYALCTVQSSIVKMHQSQTILRDTITTKEHTEMVRVQYFKQLICCWGWVGFTKSYLINRVGHVKILCLLTRWVVGSKKGPKHAYVIYEWSPIKISIWSTSLNRSLLIKQTKCVVTDQMQTDIIQ